SWLGECSPTNNR
ncbi:hypothetical protein ECEC1850_4596, partial [Escherichia coli EC1850]